VLHSRMPRLYPMPAPTDTPGLIHATPPATLPAINPSEQPPHQQPNKDPLPLVTETPRPGSLTAHMEPTPGWNTTPKSTTPQSVRPETADHRGPGGDIAGKGNTPTDLPRQANNNDGPPFETNDAELDPVPALGRPSAETNNIDGTALSNCASKKQQEWARCFNNVQNIAELEDHLLQYGEEAKAASRVGEQRTSPPRPRESNPPRRQPRHQTYDAEEASRIKKLYRRCRPRAFREITEADSPFCDIPAEELHEHYSRVFSSRGPPQQAMPTYVPE
jgi:hypothetical protein